MTKASVLLLFHFCVAPSLRLLAEPVDVFQFNFGNAEYRGTNSPGHASGSVPARFDEWVTVNGSDLSFGPGRFVRYRRANGAPADSGVTLTQTSSLSNRSGVGEGIFGTALTQSWRSYSRGGNPGRASGVWFEGLPPGEYTVYAVAHNPVLVAADRGTNLGIGVGSRRTGDLAWNDPGLNATQLPARPRTDQWEEGVNYARAEVRITAENPILYVIQGGALATVEDSDFHGITAVQLLFHGENRGPVPAEAGEIVFTRAEQREAFDALSIEVELRRRGGSAGVAELWVRSVDGTAEAGRDFVQVQAQLRWEDGDSGPQTLRVTPMDHPAARGTSFTLQLESPRGVRIGDPARLLIRLE